MQTVLMPFEEVSQPFLGENAVPPRLAHEIGLALKPWDERFWLATRASERPIEAGDEERPREWWFRIPVRSGPEVERYLLERRFFGRQETGKVNNEDDGGKRTVAPRRLNDIKVLAKQSLDDAAQALAAIVQARSGSRARSNLVGTGTINGQRVFRMETYIPTKNSPLVVAGLLAHEGAHGQEALDTQLTAKERYARGEKGVWMNQVGCVVFAKCQHYETQFAIDFEEEVVSEARQAPTASTWTIIDSLSSDAFGDLGALFDFTGTLWIDGINLTGVLSGPSR